MKKIGVKLLLLQNVTLHSKDETLCIHLLTRRKCTFLKSYVYLSLQQTKTKRGQAPRIAAVLEAINCVHIKADLLHNTCK